MTIISPKQFYDDYDNQQEIKSALKREKSKKCFIFLYDYFFVKKKTTITVMALQEGVLIYNHALAYQTLMSLCVLNLLNKQKVINRRAMVFFPKNDEWWQTINEYLKKDTSENVNN